MDTIECCGNNGMHSHVLQHCYLKEMELRNSESQAPNVINRQVSHSSGNPRSPTHTLVPHSLAPITFDASDGQREAADPLAARREPGCRAYAMAVKVAVNRCFVASPENIESVNDA
jgi:hypothetical protein